jgi:NAD(P)-dependent dehydrogenase (short-subunit alcohol dehydrogenase family)
VDVAGTDLTGKVALVSGASRGVGRTYALALARAGARVIATGRTVKGDPHTPGSLSEVAATARESGLDLVVYACDVEDEDDIVDVAQQAIANYGGVDVLVNNAAVLGAIPHLEVSRETWEEYMRVNVRAPYVFMRQLIPQMAARGGGSVISITTGGTGAFGGGLAAVRGSRMHDDVLHYGVSKAALDRMTVWFATEYEPDNVAVNGISPGQVGRYMSESGREPDPDFWGPPLLHLARQRPKEGGVTGRVFHTYEYGRTFGPGEAASRPYDEVLTALLREAGFDD